MYEASPYIYRQLGPHVTSSLSKVQYSPHHSVLKHPQGFKNDRLQVGRSRVPYPMRSLDFSIDLILPAALWRGVDSASNRNEHQQSSWG
jgi:hypothetical protein